MLESEIETIRKAAKGDDNAFTELLQQYEPLIISQSRRFASSFTAVTGEDLTQEARLAFYRAVCTYDPGQKEVVTFGLYAKVCIRNALVSELRRARSHRRSDSLAGADVHRESARSSSAEERREIVLLRSRMESLLSPYERSVFSRFLAGLRAREIAQELGKPVKSVYNALSRIRIKIRAERGK